MVITPGSPGKADTPVFPAYLDEVLIPELAQEKPGAVEVRVVRAYAWLPPPN
jgi:hypothetical protein